MHAPPESQSCPPPQLVPSDAAGCAQTPDPLHVSPVQGLPSSGQAMPAAVLLLTQVLAWQACLTQAESTAQSSTVTHPMQLPAPSQVVLPPQPVPTAANGWLGTPLVQISLVQGIPSSTEFVSSMDCMGPPCPSQVTFMQSPATPPPGLPSPLGVNTGLHTFVVVLHVNELHAVVGPQSLSLVQEQLPAASHESSLFGPHIAPACLGF